MLNYKVEDLKFLNMKMIESDKPTEKIFSIERELSEDEKIEFLDNMNDGIISYILNLANKWNAEKVQLPKDQYGIVKTVSKKAWIRRNDTKKIIDTEHPLSRCDVGRFYLFDELWHLDSDCNKHLVCFWFHDFCEKLLEKEREYFKEHCQS